MTEMVVEVPLGNHRGILPLSKSGHPSDDLLKRETKRVDKLMVRRVLQRCRWVPEKVKNCGKRAKGREAELWRSTRTNRAHWSGLQSCKTCLCPTCMAAYAAKRRGLIEGYLEALHDRGGGECLITFTLRHDFGDLMEMRHVLSEAISHVTGHEWWRKMTKSVGYVGYVWIVEVTHGQNGWHPHLHLLLLTDRTLDHDTRSGMELLLGLRWVLAVKRAQRLCSWIEQDMTPDLEHGVTVVHKSNVADYLNKMGLSAELAAAPTKRGRGESSRSLSQILAHYAHAVVAQNSSEIPVWSDLTDGKKLLQDYYYSMKGFKICFTTPGLAKRIDALTLVVPAELAQSAIDAMTPERGERELIMRFAPEDWRFLNRMGPVAMAQVEGVVEQGGGRDAVENILEVMRADLWRPPEDDFAYGQDPKWDDARPAETFGWRLLEEYLDKINTWSPAVGCDVPQRYFGAVTPPQTVV